jgi:mono/diheme cytochrome c family protein
VARGELQDSDPIYRGTAPLDTTFVAEIPVPVDEAVLARGQARYQIFCAPCHGAGGLGDGKVHLKAQAATDGSTWVPPTNLTDQTVVDRPAGHIYNTIANGLRNMPAYGSQIPVDDRWAIVAYVRELQKAATQ